jgi:hypothetical protein
MRYELKRKGSVFLLSVFVVAMLSTLVIGMLKINSGEIQLIRNQIYASQAMALAEAGLNAALAEMRDNALWQTGFDDVIVGSTPGFEGGHYDVEVDGSKIKITGSVASWQGYTATVQAEVTISADDPHIIRIDSYRINEPFEE